MGKVITFTPAVFFILGSFQEHYGSLLVSLWQNTNKPVKHKSGSYDEQCL